MFKRLAQSAAIPYIGGTLIWAYMSLLAHTMRWRVEGVEHLQRLWTGPQGWMAATWHSRILMMPMVQIIYRPKWPKPPVAPTLMVSTSRDGNFTNRAGRLLGLNIIRGSAASKKGKEKRGFQAAREAMDVMNKGGGLVVTIDGPKGPAEVVGIGAVKLAQQVGAHVLVYGLSAHAKRMNTWDRLLFPKPFARGAVVIGEPIICTKAEDSEQLRQRIEVALKEVTRRADELAGLPPLPVAERPAPPAAAAPATEAAPAEMERHGS